MLADGILAIATNTIPVGVVHVILAGLACGKLINVTDGIVVGAADAKLAVTTMAYWLV